MPKFEWTLSPGKYSFGSTCKAGGYPLGTTHQPTQSKGYTGPRWAISINLPGVKIREGLFFQTEDEAKITLERVIMRWLDAVNGS